MNLEAFAGHLRDHDRTEATVRRYCELLARFAVWYRQTNGRELAQPEDLTPTDVREYRDWLQLARKSPATINVSLSAIRAYGAWLVDSEQLPANPARNTKLIAEVETAPRWLERRELAALIRAAQRATNTAQTENAHFLAVRNEAIVQLLANSGIRLGELCALELADLKLSERAGLLTVRHGKGNKARQVPLNVEARRALGAWLEVRPEAAARLFSDRRGKALERRMVRYVIEGYGKRAGVAVTPHTLRHTFAHSLADAGVPDSRIAALLGHASLNSTRIYTMPSLQDLARDVERLEG